MHPRIHKYYIEAKRFGDVIKELTKLFGEPVDASELGNSTHVWAGTQEWAIMQEPDLSAWYAPYGDSRTFGIIGFVDIDWDIFGTPRRDGLGEFLKGL